MKWYFASRTRYMNVINSIAELLKNYNHEIIFNWALSNMFEPYHENEESCKEISQKISSSIKDSDIFVLISDAEGTDMFVELGIAIQSYMNNKNPKIYIIGEYNKRSLMHLHPAINHIDSLKEVLTKECPNIKEEELIEIIDNLQINKEQ